MLLRFVSNRTFSSLFIHEKKQILFYFSKRKQPKNLPNLQPPPIQELNIQENYPNHQQQHQEYTSIINKLKSNKDYKAIIETTKKFIKHYPENFEIAQNSLHDQWNAYFELRQWASALSAFKQAFEMDRSFLEPAKVMKLKSLLSQQLLQKARNPKSPEQGTTCASMILYMEPKNIEALKIRATFMSSFKKYKEALDDLNNIINIQENNLEALEMKLEILLAMNDFKDIIKTTTAILNINTIDEKLRNHCFLNRATSLIEIGDFQNSLQDLETLLKDPSSLHPETRANALYFRGIALRNTLQYDESINTFEQLMKEDSSNLDAKFQKIETLVAAKRFSEALQENESYISLLSSSEDIQLALFTKGKILKEIDKKKEANETFESILKYKEIPPLLHLKVLKEAGKLTEAKKLLTKLQQSFPENEELKNMKINE